MCNRYRTDKANAELQDALEEWREVERLDEYGRNMPEPYEMFPNKLGRVVSIRDDKLVVTEALWGMPTPANRLVTKTGKLMAHDPGLTNIRQTEIRHWQQWMGVEYRCLVPFTRFCEPDQVGKTYKDTWFSFADGSELAFFAGVTAALSRQIRVKDPEVTTGSYYAFLTTDANEEVAAFHDKAMPVILTNWGECERWLTGAWSDVRELQRSLPDGTLTVVNNET